ncbi:MAG: GAF domain-containing protein [Anaerolineae bacterium]|jgi:signal transduction histidine kinase
MWAILLIVAWSRQRHADRPREKLLVWGFGLALFRELLMFTSASIHVWNKTAHDMLCIVLEPVEHTLGLASVVVIAGSYLRYVLDDAVVARRYLRIGLGATALGFLATFLWWPGQLATVPGTRFHQTWPAWLMHFLAMISIAIAMIVLIRKRGWLRNVVLVAFSFLFLSEFFLLLNFFTSWQHSHVFCPIGNSLHILAVPLFGYVYFREQSIEKKQAEDALRAYRDHLEELVTERTTELTSANQQLQSEIKERKQAQAETARRNAELAAQNAIAATISQSLDLPTILDAALERALAVLGMESGRIYLRDPDDGRLVLRMEQEGSVSPWMRDERHQRLCQEISERAVIDLKPIVVNVRETPRQARDPSAGENGHRLMVSTPLVSQGRALGALTLGAQEMVTIAPQEIDLLAAIGQQIGMAVGNARLYRETERWAGGMALLHEVSVFLSSTLDPAEISDQITQQSAKLVDCPLSYLYQWGEGLEEAVRVSSYGTDNQRPEMSRLKIDESPLPSQLVSQHQPICIEDAQKDPRVRDLWRAGLGFRAMLCFPVWGTGKPLGFLLLVEPHRTRRWLSHEVELLNGFMDRAAVALENAHLHKQLEWAAALEERQRIAAEMHDGLAQTLSYVGLKTDRAAQLLEKQQIQQVPDELAQIQEAIGRASHDVRRSIASLQQSPRPRQSLQEALGQAVKGFAENSGPPTDLCGRLPEPLYLPPGDLEQVLRVVQEALLKAQRHAQARKITVLLEQPEGLIEVVVADDGRGFDPEDPPQDGDHFGLSIMRARAARLGGEIRIDSQPGRGTQVTLSWPLNSEPGR